MYIFKAPAFPCPMPICPKHACVEEPAKVAEAKAWKCETFSLLLSSFKSKFQQMPMANSDMRAASNTFSVTRPKLSKKPRSSAANTG